MRRPDAVRRSNQQDLAIWGWRYGFSKDSRYRSFKRCDVVAPIRPAYRSHSRAAEDLLDQLMGALCPRAGHGQSYRNGRPHTFPGFENRAIAFR
jgi:hypothetical protein